MAPHNEMYYILWVAAGAGLLSGLLGLGGSKADKKVPPQDSKDELMTGHDNGYRQTRRDVFDLFK